MIKRLLSTILLVLASIWGIAQTVPGKWSEYFSFNNCTQLMGVDENLFGLAECGIFIYNVETKEFTRLTKTTGLSGVGLTSMAFCDSASAILVGYTDGTIDIVQYPALNVQTIRTIAQKPIYGSKAINDIQFKNDTAILATDLGVILFSMTNKQFISTTVLSNTGEYVKAKSVTFDDKLIYAATTKGIFTTNLVNNNISDFGTWQKITEIPHANDTISAIANFSNSVYYVWTNAVAKQNDSIFKITNGKAEAFKFHAPQIRRLEAKNGLLAVTTPIVAKLYNADEKLVFNYDSLNVNTKYSDVVRLIDGSNWVSDTYYGLWNAETNSETLPNGPNSNRINDLFWDGNNLHMVAGNYAMWDRFSYNLKTYSGAWYGNRAWWLVSSRCVCADPKTGTYYVGSYSSGLAESSHAWTIDTVYKTTNSILQKDHNGDVVVSHVMLDSKGVLWLTNPGKNPIVARTVDNKWYSYAVPTTSGLINDKINIFTDMVIDRRGYKWLAGRSKIFVFYENKTLDDISDDQLVSIPLVDSEGDIATLSNCLAEDLNGSIWIGTTQGIAVHSVPAQVFRGKQSISRIKIEIDGEVGYLLSTEKINCIVVDGGNRKWVGTENSGVFLLSPNGTEQILNFTKNNSPLPSNTVNTIAIDHKTGEVYIGTTDGLVSVITDATAGDSQMNYVYSFPNPVRENYDGDIYIKGLVTDAIVKITDVSGNLVNHVQANGGTAVWNGRNLQGNRVATGVYLLHISDETGKFTKVGKILFVN